MVSLSVLDCEYAVYPPRTRSVLPFRVGRLLSVVTNATLPSTRQSIGVRNVGASICCSQELRCTVQHSQRAGCLHRCVRADAIPVAHVRGPEGSSESSYPYPTLHCSGAVLSLVLVHSYESDAFKVYRMRESISRKLAVWRVIGDARVQRVDAAVDCPFTLSEQSRGCFWARGFSGYGFASC